VAVVVVVLAIGGVGAGLITLAARDGKDDPPQATVQTDVKPAQGQPKMRNPAAAAGVPAKAPACKGRIVRPGADVQAALNAAGERATICFAKGTYRLPKALRPLDGQKLIGAPGALLTGARPLSGWARSGSAWVATADLPSDPRPFGECADGTGTACQYANLVLRDGKPLQRVTEEGALRKGTFFQDYAGDRVLVGDDPAGHRLEVAIARSAVAANATGVTIQGFVIQGFATPAQGGTILANGSGWTIRNNEVRYNHGLAINTVKGGKVIANHVHHNGQMGLGGQTGGLVEGNEINNNNTAGFSYGWEAGGTKWVETEGLIVRRNYSHDNIGPGLWTDINNNNTTYEGNLVTGNADFGIHHEISYKAVIRNNEITGNGNQERDVGYGGAGIRIAASPGVRITGNVLRGNANAIMLLQQDRSGDSATRGPHELANITVTGNDIAISQGAIGLMQDVGDRTLFERSRNIRFDANTYRLSRINGDWFAWHDELMSRSGWRELGQDRTGKFLPLS
jgi:parallel beta-helix repeat protein